MTVTILGMADRNMAAHRQGLGHSPRAERRCRSAGCHRSFCSCIDAHMTVCTHQACAHGDLNHCAHHFHLILKLRIQARHAHLQGTLNHYEVTSSTFAADYGLQTSTYNGASIHSLSSPPPAA